MSGPTNDLTVVDGQLQFTTSEAQRIAQRLTIRLLTFHSEWFANSNFGVDYFANVLGAPADATLLAEAFRPALSTELDTITSITVTFTDRGMTLRFAGFSNGLSVTGSAGINTSTGDGLPVDGGLVVNGIQITVNGIPVVVHP